MLEEVRWHACSIERTFTRLKTTREGLRNSDVEERKKQYGPNELPKEKILAWWFVFFRQFASPLMIILLIAAGISFLLGERIDGSVILAAALLNTLIGFVQEFKVNQALENLRTFIQPSAVVLRDGIRCEILAKELVPGDILLLQTGDRVTADARIIEIDSLKVVEASLTGESLPIEKTLRSLGDETALADRSNMVFAGTSVVHGSGRAVVVGIGFDSELGKIANLVSETQETQTPLQDQLTQLARWIAIVVVGLTICIFVIGILTGREPVDMFSMSIALAVAAIPEGLLVSVTIILAIGMQRILRRKALVRRLVAAETLGSVSVICSDKTGTITQGKMQATHVFIDGRIVDLTLEHTVSSKRLHSIYEAIVLCNDATFANGDHGKNTSGSPTEQALLQLADAQGIEVDYLRSTFVRTAAIPFESGAQFMVTAHSFNSDHRVYAKGAPDKILDFCDISKKQREEIERSVLELAEKGIRVLAIARKNVKRSILKLEQSQLSGFEFQGLIGLRDPLRPEARVQIEQARRAGVRTIILTGDHPKTAASIARDAGLNVGPQSVVTGMEIDKWTDEELTKRIARIVVFARVEPRHKLRIIQSLQKRGEVVAMTGDGVNDAPALKIADIGVAVGSGTEVAKQASDIILLDNNLKTITNAIEQGRVIFDNIRKVTVYLLVGSFTEIILIFSSIVIGLPLPLLPAQILWINLVADSFPNIGLAFEPGESDVMAMKPHSRDESILQHKVIKLIFVVGFITDFVMFGIYFWLLKHVGSIEEARSIMFAAVGISTLLYVFAVKSFRRTIFHINPFSNLWLVLGVCIGFGLMLLALLHPFFQTIFEIQPLSLSDWFLLIMIGLVRLFGIEIVKWRFVVKNKQYDKK